MVGKCKESRGVGLASYRFLMIIDPLYSIAFIGLFVLYHTSMKAIIAILIALAVLQTSAIDFSDIPQEEIDALEKTLQFKKDVTDSEFNRGQGLLSSLFGSDQQNNKLQFSKTINSKESQGQTQEKGEETQKSLTSSMDDIMKSLPYEALLPRRRKGSSPLDLIGSLLKQGNNQDNDESEDNPLKELDQLLLGRQRKNRGKKLNWQNPDFRQGKSEIPFTKIFGAKSRGQHGVHVKEEDIQRMLEASMPNLKGGNIIKLSQASYRRGVYLNIEYQTAKEQIYTIKAKYVRRTNELEIISLNEINIMRKADPESDNDDAVEIEEKPVAKVVEAPKVEEVKIEKQEEKKKEPVAKTQQMAEVASAKNAGVEPKVIAQEVKKEQPVVSDVTATTVKEEPKAVEKPIETKKPSQLQSQPVEESSEQNQQTEEETVSEQEKPKPSSQTVVPKEKEKSIVQN